MFKAEYAKNKLKELGMKQTWLADQLGVSSQHLSNIVNGTRKPSLKIAEDIARYIGCDWHDLWTEYDVIVFDAGRLTVEVAESAPTIEAPSATVGVYLDKDEAEVLLEWFNRGHLFEIIRNDPSVADMNWLSCMMTIYAKCKAVE